MTRLRYRSCSSKWESRRTGFLEPHDLIVGNPCNVSWRGQLLPNLASTVDCVEPTCSSTSHAVVSAASSKFLRYPSRGVLRASSSHSDSLPSRGIRNSAPGISHPFATSRLRTSQCRVRHMTRYATFDSQQHRRPVQAVIPNQMRQSSLRSILVRFPA
jgi:hypothetical protein